MPGVVRAQSLPGELPLDLVPVRVVSALWVVGVGAADQEATVRGGGQDAYVVLAVVLKIRKCKV